MISAVLILLVLPIVSYALYLATSRKVFGRIFDNLPRHARQESEATGYASPNARASPNHTLLFPPSRRHTLREVGLDVNISASDVEPQYSKLLPDREPADPGLHHDHFTATGITLREIQHLGDFPDYASISGVPLPEPYPEFDIKRAMPRPYRPFRWAYHQTMSYQKLEPNWWLELDRNYAETIRLRIELYEKHGLSVLQVLPGAELAAKELMEMAVQFLCARYPHYFHLDLGDMVFHNLILGTKTTLRSTPPIEILLYNIPEDFAIMLRDPETGIYTFRGGMIMSSLGWSLGSKIGKKLHEIHEPVPDYREKMQFSMDRYFARMPTDKPIQRGSWGIEVGKPLYMAPGDPHESEREVQNPAYGIKDMHLRVDWQTLRRLPLSGAVVFNFKGLFTPVVEFRDEPCVPRLVLKVLREGKKSMMEYKSTWHTEHVVLPALETYEKEQIDKGLMEKDWEPCTLEENPFFPGWQEKWHRQQGC